MKNIYYVAGVVVLISALLALAFFTLNGTDPVSEKMLKENTITESALKTYSHPLIEFDYPARFEQIPTRIDSRLVKLSDPDGPTLLQVNIKESDAFDFDEFVEETIYEFETVFYPPYETETDADPKIFPPEYEFSTTTYNGLPALIHRRNFGSMLSDYYEMKVWIGTGKIIVFTIEPYSVDALRLFRSVREPA